MTGRTDVRPQPLRRPSRTVALVGLGVYAALALLVLLSPLSPEDLVTTVTAWLRDDLGLSAVRQGWVEFAANMALFVPFGALVTLVFRRASPGVLAALALSAGAELVQVLLPERLASPRDVVANVLGAALGAVAVVLARRIRRL